MTAGRTIRRWSGVSRCAGDGLFAGYRFGGSAEADRRELPEKQLNFVVIKDNPSQNDPAQASRAPSPHDGKMKKALRYIDAHLSDELRLEDVAAHVYLSPYYFSKLFKSIRGSVLTHGSISSGWRAQKSCYATATGASPASRGI